MKFVDEQLKTVSITKDKPVVASNFFASVGLSFFVAVLIVSLSAGVMRVLNEYLVDQQIFPEKNYQPVVVEQLPEFRLYFPGEKFQSNLSQQIIEQENKAGPPVSKTENWLAGWLLTPVAQAATTQVVIPSHDNLLTSPAIRVGLFWTNRQEQFSAAKGFSLYSGDELILTSNGDWPIVMWYDRQEKKYFFSHQHISLGYDQPLRLLGSKDSILKIDSYSNPPSWNLTLPDNQFRGSLELYFSTSTGQIWVINELPLEDYLKGLGETRATDPFEYLKTMTVVGRTYAYWHKMDNFKHGHRGFQVDAFYDQVYRGYDSELRHPELVRAVDETFGQMVTYQGEVAITPYFARSNGRTKNWSEVWYQDPYPWIKSVEVPEEKGFSQLGHGVGLSGVGAMIKANRGESYKEIIKFFYHQVEVMAEY